MKEDNEYWPYEEKKMPLYAYWIFAICLVIIFGWDPLMERVTMPYDDIPLNDYIYKTMVIWWAMIIVKIILKGKKPMIYRWHRSLCTILVNYTLKYSMFKTFNVVKRFIPIPELKAD